MEDQLHSKLRRRRWRSLAVVIVLAAAAAVVLLSTKVERADYTGALRGALEDARSLLTACSEKAGNGEGQYAPFTL